MLYGDIFVGTGHSVHPVRREDPVPGHTKSEAAVNSTHFPPPFESVPGCAASVPASIYVQIILLPLPLWNAKLVGTAIPHSLWDSASPFPHPRGMVESLGPFVNVLIFSGLKQFPVAWVAYYCWIIRAVKALELCLAAQWLACNLQRGIMERFFSLLIQNRNWIHMWVLGLSFPRIVVEMLPGPGSVKVPLCYPGTWSF